MVSLISSAYQIQFHFVKCVIIMAYFAMNAIIIIIWIYPRLNVLNNAIKVNVDNQTIHAFKIL